MPQIHYQQFGTFHVTTKTKDNLRWCTNPGVPECLIDHLCKARDIDGAKLHAFCILPNHIHMILCPGPKGLSAFMQAFKSNSTKSIRTKKGLIKVGWQTGFYDERIRDEKQRSAALAYVHGNAMKHRLVREVMDWPWTSLHYPSVIDVMDFWFM